MGYKTQNLRTIGPPRLGGRHCVQVYGFAIGGCSQVQKKMCEAKPISGHHHITSSTFSESLKYYSSLKDNITKVCNLVLGVDRQ